MIKKILDTRHMDSNKTVVYCTRCINSNQRPGLTFDEQGVCDACQYSDLKEKVIDWNEREKELVNLLDKYRSKDGSFDVIVPSSGGKDSCFVAHQLKHKYNMHPLAVTWAPAIYTDIGWQNLQSFRHAGFDTVLCLPDGKVYAKLARLGFELMGDPFWPWHYGQRAFPLNMAVKFKIPLIIYGEMTRVEYGGGRELWYKPNETYEDLKNYFHINTKGVDSMVDEGLKYGLIDNSDLSSIALYRLPHLEEVKKLGTEVHWFSYYKKWIPQENYYYATKHCGFKPNPKRSEGTYSKYASLDDKIDGLHFYMQYIKFGFGRCTSEASQEVRSGHINREEAVALANKYDGEFPQEHFKECLEYMGISEEDFWNVADQFRPPHLWEKIDGQWHLKTRLK